MLPLQCRTAFVKDLLDPEARRIPEPINSQLAAKILARCAVESLRPDRPVDRLEGQ
jgi:hypothetical protein